VLLVGAVAVFGVWLLRSAGFYAAQVFDARLASRVELQWMGRVLQKLLTLSVGFFDKSSRGELVMTAYNDTKYVRLLTLHFGQVFLFVTQIVGLMAAAWVMSAKLTLVGSSPCAWGNPGLLLGQRLTNAARQERGGGIAPGQLPPTDVGHSGHQGQLREGQILERARKVSQLLWRNVLRQSKLIGRARLLLESVSGFGLILVLVIGGGDVAAGRMPGSRSWASCSR